MGGYPSGQREQTVNLLAKPAEVQILLRPSIIPKRRRRVPVASQAKRGSSSAGRALAFQANCRGFKSRLPLFGFASDGVFPGYADVAQ